MWTDEGVALIRQRIDELLSRQGRVLVAIDGKCASGKTTLAARLAECYDCNVFHMDDFFLRPEQRTEERYARGHSHAHAHSAAHDHSQGAGHRHCDEETPMEELLALMKYMVSHNDAHAQEMAELASRIRDAGKISAYKKIMDAVADFDILNAKLDAVLKELMRDVD